MNMKEARVK